MKKIICFIFGHLPFTYNCGTQVSPEQGWGCAYCGKDLTFVDEYWGLNLNNKVTKYLHNKNNKITNDDDDFPF